MKIFLLGVPCMFLATAAFAQDIPELLGEAQRAYLRGDLATAKEKFSLVQRLDPNNRVAVSNLRRIAMDEAKDAAKLGPGNVTATQLKGIILPSVQFADATLPETLDYLQQKGTQIGGGKVAINFVMQLDEAAKARKVTLKLQNVPFTEVLRYLGELADVQFVYERFAIMVKPKGAAPAAGEAAPVPSGVKIDGL